jgi:hypothetical protein
MGDQDSQFIRIQRALWNKSDYRSLSDDAKLLFLYINSCPHGNLMCYYLLPTGYACEDLSWDGKRFAKGLGELLDKRLILYDHKTHVVLDLHHILKFPPQNPNQVKAAKEKFNDLPFNSLIQPFIELLERLEEPFIKPLLEHISKRLGEHVYVEEEVKVKEKEKENILQNTALPSEYIITKKKRKLNGSRYEDFMNFWKIFNYKSGKAEAADAWLDIVGYSEETVNKIIISAAIEAGKRQDLISQGKTPKMAQGWITARRWEDEGAEIQGGAKPLW